MISSVSSRDYAPQGNFDPHNLPPGSEDFYNSTAFAANQAHFLSSIVSDDEKQQLKGLQDIKNAINGQT